MSNYKNLIIQSPFDFVIYSGQLKNSILFYDKIIIPDFSKVFSENINQIRNRPIPEFLMFWDTIGKINETEIYSVMTRSQIENHKKNVEELFAPYRAVDKTLSLLEREGITEDRFIENIGGYNGDEWLKSIDNAKLYKKPKDEKEQLLLDRNTVWFLQDKAILELSEREKLTSFYQLTEPEFGYEETQLTDTFPNKVENFILKSCDFQIPDFQRATFEDVLEIRTKYSDELSQARLHISKLSFDIASKFKNEKPEELEKWIDYYCTEIIKPQITQFSNSIFKERNNKIKKVVKSVAGMTSFILSLSNWRSLIPELLKTGLELDETLKNSAASEQSFIKLMGLTYKK
jgi:hypothetical protein